MARGHVWITPSSGTPQKYRVLDWKVGQRPAQAADPAALVIAEWRIDGPMGTSYEDITEGFGYLGIDYTTNADSRWNNVLSLGPLSNSVTLSSKDTTWTGQPWGAFVWDTHVYDAGPSADTICGFALMEGAGTVYLYVARGRYVTKVDLADMTVKETHVLPENATSIVASTTAIGIREVTVGMRNHAYHVMTSVATPPNPDTWIVNDGNVAAAIIASGGDRMVAAGKNPSGTANIIAGQQLTGTVTMGFPTWLDIATIPGSVTVTGFGLDGPFYVVMTDEGPYMLDEEKREFFPLIDEIPRSMENRVVGKWFALGTLLGLATGARFSRFGSGESYGLEKFPQNTSPVQGFMTGQTASARWSYEAWYNPVEGDTTIIAWRDRNPRDGHANSVMSPFAIISVPDARVNAIVNVDNASGKRTNPTLIYGEGANTLRWVTLGRNAREIDDSNYRFASSGTAYLTELKRYPGMTKQLQAVEFETDNCAAAKTVTFGVSVDGAAAVTLPAVTTDGWQRLVFASGGVPLTTTIGKNIKPQLAFATDSSSVSPLVKGPLRLHMKVRPILTEYIDATLLLEPRADETPESLQDGLFSIDEGSTVLVGEDDDRDRYYVDVESVETSWLDTQKTRGEDRPNNAPRLARVRLVKWPTASGD